jgi:hypothetical protein
VADAKYGYGGDPTGYADVLGLHPTRAIAWGMFPKDATRFMFG